MANEASWKPTADLSDELGEDACRVLVGPWRSYGGRARFRGRVSTVRCYEDNSLVKRATLERGDGRVLLVDAAGSLHRALVGDMLGANLAKNGWAGVVVFGAVRDVAELARLDLGVVAVGACPRRSNQRGAGERDVPVSIRGVRVDPGAELVADEDGVVVIVGGEGGGAQQLGKL